MNLSSATWHRPWCFGYALIDIMSSPQKTNFSTYLLQIIVHASLASCSLARLLTFNISDTPIGIIVSPTRILHVLRIVSVEPLDTTPSFIHVLPFTLMLSMRPFHPLPQHIYGSPDVDLLPNTICYSSHHNFQKIKYNPLTIPSSVFAHVSHYPRSPVEFDFHILY
jgi:hypothetical protein